MKYLSRSSRVFMLLALLLAVSVVLAACDDAADELVDDVQAPTEAPADDPPTPEPVETPADVPDATDDEQPAEDEPTPTPETESESTPAIEEDEEPEDTPEADDDQDATSPRSVLVYLVRNEEIAAASRDIAGAPEVATGALNELLTGITPYEQDLGLGTEIPAEARLLGVSIQDDGTGVVDLSPEFEAGGGSLSMQMRLAQIVFTMTQFDTVDQVQVRIDGQDVESIGGEGVMVDQPLTREDFEDLSPAILLESPTPGEVVQSPIQLRGTSNTFEATLQYEIIDANGNVIYEDFGTATSGTGTRGTFDISVDVEIQTEGLGQIVMFESSAQDGSRINIIEIPVDLRQ